MRSSSCRPCLGNFLHCPRGNFLHCWGLNPLLASGGASLGDQSITPAGDRSLCCATARSYRKEIRTLSRHLHVKETTLALKNQLLQQKEAELLEKESIINNLKLEKESAVSNLKQDLLRASSTTFCLHHEIDFWKSGVAQVDV